MTVPVAGGPESGDGASQLEAPTRARACVWSEEGEA